MQIANACDDRWRVKNALGLRVYPVGVRHGHRFTAESRILEYKRRQRLSLSISSLFCGIRPRFLCLCDCTPDVSPDGRTDLIYEAALSGKDKERTKRKESEGTKAVNYAIRSSERATGPENGSRCCPPARLGLPLPPSAIDTFASDTLAKQILPEIR